MIIVRELLMGVNRFQGLLAQTGATPQLLTARLKRLEAGGMIKRHAYSKRPMRYEYRLTSMGHELRPVILALRTWGETWVKRSGEGIAVRVTHTTCGTKVRLDGYCPTCDGIVAWTEMQGKPTPAYLAERRRREAEFVDRARA